MYRIIQNVFLVTGLIVLLSCNRQVDCPDFNNTILDWTPYHDNDTICLVNTTGDAVLILIINDLVIEHTTHYLSNTDCGTCDDQIMINNSETNTDFQINIALNENRIITQQYIVKGIFFTDYNSTYSELSGYSFGSRIFESVRIFENQTTDGFQKLIVAKDFGIIGLIESDGVTWIPGNLKNNEPGEKVSITTKSCN